MSRTCTICLHPQRESIDRALVAGQPYRSIAQHFGASAPAVLRHKVSHLRDLLARERRRQHRGEQALRTQERAQEQKRVEQALDVVQQLKAINAASLETLSKARSSGDGDLVLKAVDRVQRQIELQAKLLGELDTPHVNVLLAPEWVSIRGSLLAALGPYPEARTAVAQQLLSLEASNGHR